MRRDLVLIVAEPANFVLEPRDFFAQFAEQGFELFTGWLGYRHDVTPMNMARTRELSVSLWDGIKERGREARSLRRFAPRRPPPRFRAW